MSSLSSASSATTNIFITGTAEGSLSFFDTRKLRQTPPLRCPGVLAVGHIGFEESSNAIVASGMSGVCAFHIHRSNARYLGSYNPPTMLTRPVAATAANEFAGLTAMHVLSPDVTPVVNAFVDGENKRVVLTTSSGRLCVGSFNQLLAGLESAPLVSLREGGGLVPAGVLRPLFDNVHDTTVGASASASASASAAVVGSAATMSSAMAGASEASTFLRNAAGSSQALVSNPLEARDWFAPMTAPMMPSAVAGPPPPLPFVVDDEDMDIGDAAVVGGGSVGADVLSASMISFGFGTASPIATPRIDGPVRELAMSGESLLPSTVGTAAAGDGGGGELENSLDVLMASIGM